MIYRKLRQLSIHNFNEVLETNDKRYLIKYPYLYDIVCKIGLKKYIDDILNNVWSDIIIQYNELKDDENKGILSKKDKMFSYWYNRYYNLTILRAVMPYIPEEERLEIFKKFSIKDINKLDGFIASAKKRFKDIEKEVKEIRESSKNDDNKEKPFEYVLAVMKENSYYVDRHKTNVAEYISIINRMSERAKKNEEEIEKMKRNGK